MNKNINLKNDIINTINKLVLMSEEKMKSKNLKPLAKIIGHADAETEPVDFCTTIYYFYYIIFLIYFNLFILKI